MAPITPITITFNLSPETASLFRTAAIQDRDRVARELSAAQTKVGNLQREYEAAEQRLKDIEAAVTPRTEVGTRQYKSDSRVNIAHTVTKYRSGSGKEEYECTCESYRFSRATPKNCKHTQRAIYDWFVQPRWYNNSFPSSTSVFTPTTSKTAI